jgi:hypothetical protein
MKRWARSRVVQASIGAILIGGIAATWVILPSLHQGLLGGSPAGSTSQQTTQAHSTAQAGANGGPNTPTSSRGSSQVGPHLNVEQRGGRYRATHAEVPKEAAAVYSTRIVTLYSTYLFVYSSRNWLGRHTESGTLSP